MSAVSAIQQIIVRRQLVDQPGQPRAAEHPTAALGGECRGPTRRQQLQAAMGPEAVVVIHVLVSGRLVDVGSGDAGAVWATQGSGARPAGPSRWTNKCTPRPDPRPRSRLRCRLRARSLNATTPCATTTSSSAAPRRDGG